MHTCGLGVLKPFPKLEHLSVVLVHNKYFTFCCQKGRVQLRNQLTSSSVLLFPPNAAEMMHNQLKTTASRYWVSGNIRSQSASRQTRGF